MKLNARLDELVGLLESRDSFLSRASSAHTLLGTLAAVQDEVKKVSYQQRVLRSLEYPGMDAGREMVRPTYANTLHWIFEGDSGRLRASKYTRWLERGIFWISGKPGSGKSTLMKYISHHEQTSALLRNCAGKGTELVVASHYLWIAGTCMQKSQLGLLQSLLMAILRQCPSLIGDIEVGASVSQGKHDVTSSVPHHWSQELLFAALEKLKNKDLRAGGKPVKFCYFIDGLDEYKRPDGNDHEDHIMEVLEAILRSSNNIKLCVASRPWNAFERILGNPSNHDRSLKVQYHTKPDTEAFARGKIGGMSGLRT